MLFTAWVILSCARFSSCWNTNSLYNGWKRESWLLDNSRYFLLTLYSNGLCFFFACTHAYSFQGIFNNYFFHGLQSFYWQQAVVIPSTEIFPVLLWLLYFHDGIPMQKVSWISLNTGLSYLFRSLWNSSIILPVVAFLFSCPLLFLSGIMET